MGLPAETQPFGEILALTPSGIAQVTAFLPKRVLLPLQFYADRLREDYALPMLACPTFVEAVRNSQSWLDDATLMRIAATGLLWNAANVNVVLWDELGSIPERLHAVILPRVRERLGDGPAASLTRALDVLVGANRDLFELVRGVRTGRVPEYRLQSIAAGSTVNDVSRADIFLFAALYPFDPKANGATVHDALPQWMPELFATLEAQAASHALRVSRVVHDVAVSTMPLVTDERLVALLAAYRAQDADSVRNALAGRPDVVTLLEEAREAITRILGEGTAASLAVKWEDGQQRFWVRIALPGGLDAVLAGQERFEREWWLQHLQDAGGVVSIMVRGA